MGYQVKQSTTAYPLVFLMVDSTDHVTAKTGLSPTVTISKAGGSFASPSGAVTEIANGWYKVAGNATDSATLGPLILHATGTAADPVDIIFEVVAFDPQDAVRLGLTALPNAAAEASGGLYTRGTGAGQINQPANGQVDTNVVKWLGTACSTPTTAGVPNVNTKTWNDLATVALPLTPTTAGRTLDVSAGGEAGLDWANVGSPTTTVSLSGTTVGTCTTNTDMRGTNSAFLAASAPTNFSSLGINSSGHVSRVTLVDTTTTNTDMRGTDSAYLAATGTSDRSTYWSPCAVYGARNDSATTLEYGTPQAGATSTTIVLGSGSSSDNTAYQNCGVVWGQQSRTIISYNGTTKVATIDYAWVTTPTASGTYQILAARRPAMDSAGNFTNDTAQGTDLTAVANDVDNIYTLVNATGVQISDAHIDQIADTTLRRTMANVELSSYGNTISMGSLYGLVQQAQESNTTAHANKLTIFKTDGTTELGQRTIATDAAANPITGIS